MMKNKILGSLTFSAIADAMGAATENLTFTQIRRKFNGKVTTFLKPDEDNFALGNIPGQVTDDFSQTYLISKEIINDKGKVTTEGVKKAIIKWSDMPEYFNRFAGPTTRSAVEMYKTGSDKPKAAEGAVTVDYASKATNGSAMKVSPAGFMNPNNIGNAIKDAITITQVTHDNHLAISGACAVAAAISIAMKDEVSIDEIIEAGLKGAIEGEKFGKLHSREVGGPSVVERIKLAVDIANEDTDEEVRLKKLYDIIGSGLHISEAVPCAFGIIKLNNGKVFESVVDAVNIGYDTDTIGIIVGSIVGCLYEKDSKVEKMLDLIEEVNDFNIRDTASELEMLL